MDLKPILEDLNIFCPLSCLFDVLYDLQFAK
jgi:hypothetical protein